MSKEIMTKNMQKCNGLTLKYLSLGQLKLHKSMHVQCDPLLLFINM